MIFFCLHQQNHLITICCGPWTHRALSKVEMEDKLGQKLTGKTESVYFYITNGFWELEIPKKFKEHRTGFSRCHGDLTHHPFSAYISRIAMSLHQVTTPCHSDASLMMSSLCWHHHHLNVISSTTLFFPIITCPHNCPSTYHHWCLGLLIHHHFGYNFLHNTHLAWSTIGHNWISKFRAI